MGWSPVNIAVVHSVARSWQRHHPLPHVPVLGGLLEGLRSVFNTGVLLNGMDLIHLGPEYVTFDSQPPVRATSASNIKV